MMKDDTTNLTPPPSEAALLASILDHVAESVSVFDTEWRVIYSNETAHRMGKTTREETRGKSIWELHPEFLGTVYEEMHRRAMEEQIPLTFEFYYAPFDGWYEKRLYPTPETLTVFTTNITERKKFRGAQEQEQERLQKTLNAADVGTWRWDLIGDTFTADRVCCAFFDLTLDDLNPHDASNFKARIHPDDAEKADAALLASVEHRQRYADIYRVVHLDGSVHWLDGRGHLEFDHENNPIALIGTAIDITAQKEAEEKYRTLFHSVDQSFSICEMIWDDDGKPLDYRLLEVNPVFERMTGLMDAAGKTARELVPDLEEFWFERYGQVARTGEAIRFQHGTLPIGSVFDVFCSSIGGDRVAILFTDITEKIQREQEAEALNERLRRAVAETHHRVKNNLQVITALIEMQADTMANEEFSASMKQINQHIQSLAIIHDLLTQHAKDDGDLSHLGTEEVLETLLAQVQNTIGDRRIVTHIDDILLTAQKAASLALLVSECVSNAVKHSNGTIEISLRNEGKSARLEICDDGDGFPQGFDPRKAANTGLQLIESAARWDLGGDVRYDNHSRGGGRVAVTFPV